jgi:hypothetical protein
MSLGSTNTDFFFRGMCSDRNAVMSQSVIN